MAMLGPRNNNMLFMQRDQWTKGKPQHPRYHRDPDAMDVDMTTVGSREGQSKKLTPEEKQRRLKEG